MSNDTTICDMKTAPDEFYRPKTGMYGTISRNCRDKGRMWGGCGGLVLVLVRMRSRRHGVGGKGQTTPPRTSTRPPHPLHTSPCPYRTRTPPPPFPHSVGKVHQDEDAPTLHYLIRWSQFIRGGDAVAMHGGLRAIIYKINVGPSVEGATSCFF